MAQIKHGQRGRANKSKEYNAWDHMKTRCYNPKSKNYKHYGGRGISVCDRWLNSFENFFADMGPAPTRKHTLERVNNSVNYEPSNCIWATQKEQNNNRRKPTITTRRERKINVGGEMVYLSEYAAPLGISYAALKTRLRRGWSLNEALKTPSSNRRDASKAK